MGSPKTQEIQAVQWLRFLGSLLLGVVVECCAWYNIHRARTTPKKYLFPCGVSNFAWNVHVISGLSDVVPHNVPKLVGLSVWCCYVLVCRSVLSILYMDAKW